MLIAVALLLERADAAGSDRSRFIRACQITLPELPLPPKRLYSKHLFLSGKLTESTGIVICCDILSNLF